MRPEKEAWVEHQRRRWMRHDAHRWMRPDARQQKGTPKSQTGTDVGADADTEVEFQQQRLAVASLRLEWELLQFALKGRKAGFEPGQPRDDHGRWTDAGDAGAAMAQFDDGNDAFPEATDTIDDEVDQDKPLPIVLAGLRPRIPPERPPTGPERTAVAKGLAIWLAERQADVADAAHFVARSSWLYHALPSIRSYLDGPKTLGELQSAASTSKAGYDVHHIVERTSAEEDGYSQKRINAPDNLASIPRMKHWEINAWFQTKNDRYGGMSPRDHLSGKNWDERQRVGLEALKRYGVLTR
jgi:hypothetical protein